MCAEGGSRQAEQRVEDDRDHHEPKAPVLICGLVPQAAHRGPGVTRHLELRLAVIALGLQAAALLLKDGAFLLGEHGRESRLFVINGLYGRRVLQRLFFPHVLRHVIHPRSSGILRCHDRPRSWP